jgi:hypothetical protein
MTGQHTCSSCSPGSMIELSTPEQAHLSAEIRCPMCGQKGKSVDGATVKCLLAISLRAVRDVPYRFCRTPGCSIVYFSENGDQVFTTAEVRERVFQKEPDADDVFVCYCFRYTPGDIRAEIVEAGKSAIVAEINTGIQTGQCACDWRNPQGSCCLGNVQTLIRQIEQELRTLRADI